MSASNGENRWVCPNDRVLTLRAKLKSGWSVKSGTPSSPGHAFPSHAAVAPSPSSHSLAQSTTGSLSGGQSSQITDMEQEAILDVIRRAQHAEKAEKDRIDRLIERLNNMKRNAAGDGRTSCALCNERFHLFGAQCHQCKDCAKSVCSKCGVDAVTPDNETVWFCKICSETREMWKKSGAWFFQALPTFALSSPVDSPLSRKPSLSSQAQSISLSSIPSHIEPQTPQTPQTPTLSLAKVNSTKILSSSPVIRRKTRSPSPRAQRRHGNGHPFSATEYGATLEAKPVSAYNGDLWDPNDPDYLQRH